MTAAAFYAAGAVVVAVLIGCVVLTQVIETARSSRHDFAPGAACRAPRCAGRSGYLCEVCGHWFAANQVKTGGGRVRCAPGRGHATDVLGGWA